MKSGLAQTHARHLARRRPIDHVLHQTTADTLVLHGRINGDRANADDCGTLIQEVAADDSSISLGYDAVAAGRLQQHTEQADCSFRGWKFPGERMRIIDRAECSIADLAASAGVIGHRTTEYI